VAAIFPNAKAADLKIRATTIATPRALIDHIAKAAMSAPAAVE